MYYSRKLRRDFSVTGFIPAMVIAFASVLAGITFGVKEGFLAAATCFVLYAVFSLYVYLRTMNLSYLAASLFQLFVGLYVLSRLKLRLVPFFDERLAALIYLFLLGSTVWLVYLFVRKKAKWKGREIFELASLKIETEKNGFTSRPRPSGRAEFSASELRISPFSFRKTS